MRKINLVNLFYCLLVVGIALIEDFVSTPFSEKYLYYVRPIVWLAIAIFGWFFVRKSVTIKQKSEKTIRIATIIIIFTSLYFLLGFLSGFARSPYSLTFLGILRNEYSFVLILIPLEMIRCNLVSSSKSKFQSFLVLLTMIFVFLDFKEFVETFSRGIYFNYIFGTLFTCIISQIILNYIMKHCGMTATIIWQLVSTSILYLVPILPNFNWFYNILFTSLQALVCYVFLYYSYTNEQLVKAVRVKKKKKPYVGFVVMVGLFLLVGFVSGMFPQKPIVIVSDSMNPYFARGDIVVINRNADYDVGSVIQFEQDGVQVVHRIVDKEFDESGKVYYITKGDNNNSEDAWIVYEEQIEGVLSFVVPKLGYVTIWINEIFGGV